MSTFELTDSPWLYSPSARERTVYLAAVLVLSGVVLWRDSHAAFLLLTLSQVRPWRLMGRWIRKRMIPAELTARARAAAEPLELAGAQIHVDPVWNGKHPYECRQVFQAIYISAFAVETLSPAELRFLIARAHSIERAYVGFRVAALMHVAISVPPSLGYGRGFLLATAACYLGAYILQPTRSPYHWDRVAVELTGEPEAAATALVHLELGPGEHAAPSPYWELGKRLDIVRSQPC